jgi:FKBP-type peptidyl-prolyl cis-trans isomerase
MKKVTLIVSTIALVAHNFNCYAQDTANTPTRKVIQVKSPENTSVSINPGDILNISDFTKMPSGIMYKTIKKSNGSKTIKGENLVVHYSGFLLLDGKKVGLKFDSSLDRNQPFTFKLGSNTVIQGWEISLADMKVGETRLVIIPSKLGYGSRAMSSIPADSTLIFEITLIKAS